MKSSIYNTEFESPFTLTIFGKFIIGIFLFIFLLIISKTVINYNNSNYCRTITAKVEFLEKQQIIKGSKNSMSSYYRYLVITDKGTFRIEDCFWNSKYNNSEIFFNLKKDSTYSFKLSGRDKSFWYDYPNVLKIN